MPLYEFVCGACGVSFEQLVRSATQVNSILCPACQSKDVRKKLSTFAIKGATVAPAAAANCAPGGT